MIFIDKKGYAKVWINSDLSAENPHSRNISENEMVASLLNIVENNIDKEEVESPLFSSYLSRKCSMRNLTFNETMAKLEEFLIYMKKKIPLSMKSVSDLFDEKSSTESKFGGRNNLSEKSQKTEVFEKKVNSLLDFSETKNRLKGTNSYHHLKSKPINLGLSHQNYSVNNLKSKPQTPSIRSRPNDIFHEYYNNHKGNINQIKRSPYLYPLEKSRDESRIVSPPPCNYIPKAIQSPTSKPQIAFV